MSAKAAYTPLFLLLLQACGEPPPMIDPTVAPRIRGSLFGCDALVGTAGQFRRTGDSESQYCILGLEVLGAENRKNGLLPGSSCTLSSAGQWRIFMTCAVLSEDPAPWSQQWQSLSLGRPVAPSDSLLESYVMSGSVHWRDPGSGDENRLHVLQGLGPAIPEPGDEDAQGQQVRTPAEEAAFAALDAELAGTDGTRYRYAHVVRGEEPHGPIEFRVRAGPDLRWWEAAAPATEGLEITLRVVDPGGEVLDSIEPARLEETGHLRSAIFERRIRHGERYWFVAPRADGRRDSLLVYTLRERFEFSESTDVAGMTMGICAPEIHEQLGALRRQ